MCGCVGVLTLCLTSHLHLPWPVRAGSLFPFPNCPFFCSVCRRVSATCPGGEPVQDLHGFTHRLCPAGVWSHGNLYQVWQAHERVSHLPTICDPSSACLPLLRACIGCFSALQDRARDAWALARLASIRANQQENLCCSQDKHRRHVASKRA